MLDAVRAQLQPEATSILDGQITTVAMVQRLQDEREVNTYSWRFRRPKRDPAPTFPAAGREVRLATVNIAGANGNRARAAVWLVHGRFFQIAFDKPPRSLGPVGGARVERVRLEADPMAPSSPDFTQHQLMAELTPAVRSEYGGLLREEATTGVSVLGPEELYGIDINGTRFVVIATVDGEGLIAARAGDGFIARFSFDEDEPEWYPNLKAAVEAPRIY